MNTMKRPLALALICVMLLLCACTSKAELMAEKQEALCSGRWLTHETDSEARPVPAGKDRPV